MEAISAREEDLAARENMLIIDDDEINRGILDNIFSPFYRIEEAENGRIGLNRILEKPEDLSHSQQALRDYIDVIETEAVTRTGEAAVDPLMAARKKFREKKAYGG